MSAPNEQRLPIIDMHVHAHPADSRATASGDLCAVHAIFRVGSRAGMERRVRRDAASCADPLWSPLPAEALQTRTLEILERRNVIGVLSGSPDRVQRWREAAPSRIIPGLELFGQEVDVTPTRHGRSQSASEKACN